MTTGSGLRGAVAATLLLAAAGCYRPSIDDGGFLCNTDGKPCPDGFSCSAGHCVRSSGTDAGSGTCTFGVVASVCDEPARAGQMCNPACQTGCACGRCNVDHGEAVCTAPGTKTLGQKCDPSSDDCAAGLICLGEACGNHLGRCYQHCDKDAQCTGSGSLCEVQILDGQGKDTGYEVCDLAPQVCDPISDSGCPDPSLHCYLTSGDQTLCDCSSRSQGLNQTCSIYNDCDSSMGLVCVTIGGVSKCLAACEQANPICGGGSCVPTGTKYGYCQSAN